MCRIIRPSRHAPLSAKDSSDDDSDDHERDFISGPIRAADSADATGTSTDSESDDDYYEYLAPGDPEYMRERRYDVIVHEFDGTQRLDVEHVHGSPSPAPRPRRVAAPRPPLARRVVAPVPRRTPPDRVASDLVRLAQAVVGIVTFALVVVSTVCVLIGVVHGRGDLLAGWRMFLFPGTSRMGV